MMRWDKVARGALIVVCVRDLSFHKSIHAHIYKLLFQCRTLKTGNGRGSQWMCRDGYCQPRSEFEMEMEQATE